MHNMHMHFLYFYKSQSCFSICLFLLSYMFMHTMSYWNHSYACTPITNLYIIIFMYACVHIYQHAPINLYSVFDHIIISAQFTFKLWSKIIILSIIQPFLCHKPYTSSKIEIQFQNPPSFFLDNPKLINKSNLKYHQLYHKSIIKYNVN